MTPHSSSVLLSIAIPTKNRPSYLTNLIDELLLSPRQDFEIVVSDNSDDDRLRRYVMDLDDRRVRYTYVPGWLSVVDNCNAALLACQGDYVCMLGDDDGLMLEESIEVLAEAKADGEDAVMSTVLLYSWPDITHKFVSNMGGKLRLLPMVSRRERRRVCERDKLRRVIARSGALGLEGLPCVYHGFVSRRALSDLYARTGSYFPGPSPDMANAIGVTCLLETCRHVAKPLVISGHSHTSAGGRGTRGDHSGAIAEQTHLPADTVETWHSEIPFFWSGPTIYAQSLRRALERTGATEFGQPSDACLYAACLIFEGAYRKEILMAIRTSGHSLWGLAPQLAYYALVITLHRGVQFIRNLRMLLFPRSVSLDAGSMAEAIRLLRAHEPSLRARSART